MFKTLLSCAGALCVALIVGFLIRNTLRDEGARKMPRTHTGAFGQVVHRERMIEMLARPGQQRREPTGRRLQFQQ